MCIIMMINLLNGTMGIKKKGPKSLNKRRVNAYCLAPIKMVGLVYVKRGKKRDRKIVGIGMELFFSP